MKRDAETQEIIKNLLPAIRSDDISQLMRLSSGIKNVFEKEVLNLTSLIMEAMRRNRGRKEE